MLKRLVPAPVRRLLRSVLGRPGLTARPDKAGEELAFWKAEAHRYVNWYEGAGPLHGRQPPTPKEKAPWRRGAIEDSLDAWLHLFQKRKYLADLDLNEGAFHGLRVLDVGCGPFPNLLAFRDCERFGLDPLTRQYEDAGFPLGRWSEGHTYCAAPAEAMPFPSASFDAVISVNAIDHVDDFAGVARELRRVLRPGSLFRMHVHYHRPTACEPIELNDEVFVACYSWVPGLRKATESNTKYGLEACRSSESYALWSNF